jgi:hypothetical protein
MEAEAGQRRTKGSNLRIKVKLTLEEVAVEKSKSKTKSSSPVYLIRLVLLVMGKDK